MSAFLPYSEHRIAGVAARPDARADVLFEIPHGATLPVHLTEAMESLDVGVPEGWETIFWCTTDQGAPELARRTAELLVDLDFIAQHRLNADLAVQRVVRIVRGLVPRHLADLNRRWSLTEVEQGRSSAVVPPFVLERPDELARLQQAHDSYTAHCTEAYGAVIGGGGLGMQVHTYAPRSVASAPRLDDRVEALRQAWHPDQIEHYPKRPLGQLITSRRDEPSRADARLVELLCESFAKSRVRLSLDQPFAMHPIQQLDAYAQRWPSRVMGIEISRHLLARRYEPLGKWIIDIAAVELLARSFALGLARRLDEMQEP